jgi:hypothetical protein
MKNEKPNWHLSEEQLTTLSGPNLKFNIYPSVFLNNDVTEEATKLAIGLKLFGDLDVKNSYLIEDGVEGFLASLNAQHNRNRTGADFWVGTHEAEESKKKYTEEFMVACVKALEILKWIWDADPQVRFKTKVVEMVHEWTEEEHCEVFGGVDADHIWDQQDDLRAEINKSYKHYFKN